MHGKMKEIKRRGRICTNSYLKSILNILYTLADKTSIGFKIWQGISEINFIRCHLLSRRVQSRICRSIEHNLQGHIHSTTTFMSFSILWKYQKFQTKFNDQVLKMSTLWTVFIFCSLKSIYPLLPFYYLRAEEWTWCIYSLTSRSTSSKQKMAIICINEKNGYSNKEN